MVHIVNLLIIFIIVLINLKIFEMQECQQAKFAKPAKWCQETLRLPMFALYKQGRGLAKIPLYILPLPAVP